MRNEFRSSSESFNRELTPFAAHRTQGMPSHHGVASALLLLLLLLLPPVASHELWLDAVVPDAYPVALRWETDIELVAAAAELARGITESTDEWHQPNGRTPPGVCASTGAVRCLADWLVAEGRAHTGDNASAATATPTAPAPPPPLLALNPQDLTPTMCLECSTLLDAESALLTAKYFHRACLAYVPLDASPAAAATATATASAPSSHAATSRCLMSMRCRDCALRFVAQQDARHSSARTPTASEDVLPGTSARRRLESHEIAAAQEHLEHLANAQWQRRTSKLGGGARPGRFVFSNPWHFDSTDLGRVWLRALHSLIGRDDVHALEIGSFEGGCRSKAGVELRE